MIKPSLTQFLNLSQLEATAISLTSLSCAASVSAGKFFFSDNVHLTTAAAIAIPSVVGARFGVMIAQRVSSEVLALIFNGMSVILIPTHFLVQEYRERHPHDTKGPDQGLTTSTTSIPIWDPKLAQHAAFGATSGVLSALMGVGGAPLTMSYLTLATDLPHHLVQGTMFVAVLPAVLTSAIALATGGHTPMALAAAVCCGSMVGSAAGAQFALYLTESQLRQLYMASLALLGGRSLLAAAGNISRLSRSYWASKK